MNKKICGFIVVRRVDAVSTFTYESPRFLKNIPYEGFTRDSFSILSMQYHEKLLPDTILKYFSEVRKNISDIGEYATDEISALALLEYSNKLEGEVNELIAFDMQGLENHNTKLNLEFIGIDIAFYAGSLLYEGIFSKPEMFEKYHYVINKHGLFDNNYDIIEQYIDDYCSISKNNQDLIEPVSKDKDIIKIIHLFKCKK